jgi:hypothetical protein
VSWILRIYTALVWLTIALIALLLFLVFWPLIRETQQLPTCPADRPPAPPAREPTIDRWVRLENRGGDGGYLLPPGTPVDLVDALEEDLRGRDHLRLLR